MKIKYLSSTTLNALLCSFSAEAFSPLDLHHQHHATVAKQKFTTHPVLYATTGVPPFYEKRRSEKMIKKKIEMTDPSEITPVSQKSSKQENAFIVKQEHQLILDELSKAQEEFATFDQEKTDRIFNAISEEANLQRLPLAKLAAEETGMGQLEDKVLKNGLAAELIKDRYKDSKTCGLISEDTFHGLKTYAKPVGPICALTPVTNPTSTVIAKALMMAKTRNAGIFLPHPRASKATSEAVRICREAGERAGAPKGWLQVIEKPSMDESNSIMRSDEVRCLCLLWSNRCSEFKITQWNVIGSAHSFNWRSWSCTSKLFFRKTSHWSWIW
mmetsp:Transcript_3284/g.4909  ORF Transcript_3284/g.4909 Transcript_3284/m.4909 type:complete len:328 (-) Transcript_3284:5638-6621(-)